MEKKKCPNCGKQDYTETGSVGVGNLANDYSKMAPTSKVYKCNNCKESFK